jgi:hypothetical protein
MSLETLVVVLAAWTAVGLVVAILFGHMVPPDDRERESQLSAPAPKVEFFRRKKRNAAGRQPRNLLKRFGKQRKVSP